MAEARKPPSTRARPTTSKTRADVAAAAWKKLKQSKKTKDLSVQAVLLHPTWRNQFLHYCAQEGTWIRDTLENWEYRQLCALKKLADDNEIT
jgi:hypothetical protein